MSSDGFWVNNTVCGDPVRTPFPEFTVDDAAFQCSDCPIEDGKAWRDDLFMVSTPLPPPRVTDGIPTWNPCMKESISPCQTDCPLCFSGPLIG